MEQKHHGSGDNVAGNKTTVNHISVPKIIGFTLLGVSLFVVVFLLWPDPVYLSGYVYSSGGQPEEGVSLVVNTESGQEYQSVSNTEGFFQFDRLSVKKATAGALKVQKDVRELSLALDTLDVSETGLRLHLPAGTPPFRISYYNLGSHAIDQVLQGKLNEAFGGKRFEGAYVLPNAVNQYYQRLLSDHSLKLDEYSYMQRSWQEREEEEEPKTWDEMFTAGRSDIAMLPGKGGTLSADGAMGAEIDRAQALRILKSKTWKQQGEVMPDSLADEDYSAYPYVVGLAWLDKAAWSELTQSMIAGREAAMEAYLEESREWEGEAANSAAYRKRLREEYMASFLTHLEFWNDLIGDQLPDQLIRAQMTQGGGCGISSFSVQTTLPELFIQVAILENTSDLAIQLDTFVFRTLGEQSLRAEAEVLEALATAPVEKKRLFPQGQLAPGEKLIIPQYFYAKTNKDAYLDRGDAKDFGVSDAAFLQDPDRERTPYVFGPAFQVSTVLLGPELYAFRGFDRDQLVLVDGAEVGSCPYAYTRAHAAAPWRLEDHLIYGRRKQEWEGIDTLTLHQFDGHLLIREKDPETSYLRHAYLLVQRADGTTEDLDPDEPRLRARHSGYYRMEQGDSILLRFPGFRALEGDRYQLVNAGYYLPYVPDFSYRLQAAAERSRLSF